MVCIFLLYFVIECHANMARISETAFVNSPFCGAPEGKFVILSRSKSCHINRMKTCIEIKKNPRISRGENKFEKMLAREVIILKKDSERSCLACADPENFPSVCVWGGGGGGVQIPRRGLTENFNMAKTNNLAIPEGGGTPCPPSGSPHVWTVNIIEIICVNKWN